MLNYKQVVAVVVLQKQKKYLESKQKALVARNEYLLSLDTANAAIQRYYCDDLHNIINVSVTSHTGNRIIAVCVYRYTIERYV